MASTEELKSTDEMMQKARKFQSKRAFMDEEAPPPGFELEDVSQVRTTKASNHELLLHASWNLKD